MSCIGTILLSFVSRIAILIWYLADTPLFALAFKSWILPGNISFPAWVWTLLGGIFLPCTTLVYIFVFPKGISGYEWLFLVFGLLLDLAGHGGSYHHGNRYYRRR
jgi:hypothetical protein